MKRKDLLSTLRQALGLGPSVPQAPLDTEVHAAPPQPRPSPAPRTAAPPPATPAAREPRTPAARPPGSSRITWEEPQVAKHSPSSKSAAGRSGSGGIDWGGGGGADSAVANLVGVEDAFEHTPLQPGETVAYCTRDKVAYHLSTYQFLRAQNQGRCCVCGKPDAIVTRTLPGTFVGVPVPEAPPVRPQVPVMPGEKVITLEEVPNFVGRAVLVEAFVHEVYQTANTGTYFVRFQPRQYREPPFSGFKLVIFPNYQSEWYDSGMEIESYEGQHVRVRGVVQVHPKWGVEILVNSPRVIEVVEGPKVH